MEFRVGADDINLVQTEEQGIPVRINPESVLYPNVEKDSNFGFKFRVGSDDVDLV